jgi:hypothetical protein
MSDTFIDYLKEVTLETLEANERPDLMVDDEDFDTDFAMVIYIADKISPTTADFEKNIELTQEELVEKYTRAYGSITLETFVDIMRENFVSMQKVDVSPDFIESVYKYIKRLPLYKASFKPYLDEKDLDTYYKMYALKDLDRETVRELLDKSVEEIEMQTKYLKTQFISDMTRIYRKYLRLKFRLDVKKRQQNLPKQPALKDEQDDIAVRRLKKEKYQTLLNSYETGIAPKRSVMKLYGIDKSETRNVQAAIRSRLFNIVKYANSTSMSVSITKDKCLKVIPKHYYADNSNGQFIRDYLLTEVEKYEVVSRLPVKDNYPGKVRFIEAITNHLKQLTKGTKLEAVYEHFESLLKTALERKDGRDLQYTLSLTPDDIQFSTGKAIKLAEEIVDAMNNLIALAEDIAETNEDKDLGDYAKFMNILIKQSKEMMSRMVTGIFSCLPSIGLMGNIQKVLVSLVMVYSPLETIRASTLRYLYRLYGPEPWLMLITYDILDQLTALVKSRGKPIRNKTIETFIREMINETYINKDWIGDVVYICSEAYKRLTVIKMNGGILETSIEVTDLTRFCTDFILDQLLQKGFNIGDFNLKKLVKNDFDSFKLNHKFRVSCAVIKALDLVHTLRPQLPLQEAVNVVISRTALCTHELANPLIELESTTMKDIIQGKFGPYYLACEDVKYVDEKYKQLLGQIMSPLDQIAPYETRLMTYYRDHITSRCGRDLECIAGKIKDDAIFDRETQRIIFDQFKTNFGV